MNACYSQVQAEAISQYIKNVIGMNQTIGDKAAIAFTVAFYDALGAGETVEFAFNLGCSQLVRLKEDQTPVLKTTSIHPADIQFEAGDIPPNPYLGLSAFGEKDAAFFFGREKVTHELFRIAYQQPLVAVIGASGSGKSSVVFAGLIPRLRQEGIWLIESFRPKSQPFDELAQALVRQLEPNLDGVEKVIKVGKLAESLKKSEVKLHQVVSQILENKPNKRFLLVAEQFEELYTQCQDKELQQHFIDTLLSAIQQKSITLVFTLRADFYGYVLSYRPFSDALQQIAFNPLGLMSRDELKEAIEQPAQKLNVKLQTHLAERILDDVGNEPGNLPLLEFALTQLWDNQKNGELTHKAYDDIGGVKQALVKHAEQVYSRLSDSQQRQAQRVFLALVRLGEETEDTRRVATVLDVGKQNWELVTYYLASSEVRLVVTGRNDKSGEETVEVVHEALIREWTRLREWLNNNREKLIYYRKIEVAAVEWREQGKSKDYLLQGKHLKEASAFHKEQNINFTQSHFVYDFIQTSIKAQQNNRLKFIGFYLTIPFILTVLVGLFAANQIKIRGLWQDFNNSNNPKDIEPRIQALQRLVKAGVSLNGINLSHENLINANLYGADLSGANLSNTNLQATNLTNADLRGANLKSAQLGIANLKSANLTGANLKHADLDTALLCQTIMFDGTVSNRNCINNSPLPANTTDSILAPTIPNPQRKRQIQPLILTQVLEQARRNNHGLPAETRLQVTLQYYNMQGADELVRIDQVSVIYYQATLRDAQALERAGLGTRFEILQAQVNLGIAQQKLINTISAQQITRLQLATQLGLPQSVDVAAADPVQLSGLWKWSLEESIVLASQNKSEQHKQRNEIRLEVEKAFDEMQSSLQNVQTSTFALSPAREALRLARLRFQAGVGTQTDVVAQEKTLTQVEGDRVEAIVDYNLAITSLERYVFW